MIRNAPELGTTWAQTRSSSYWISSFARPSRRFVARQRPPSAQRAEAGTGPARRLPGEPANRLSPNRTEPQSPEPAQR